MQRQPNNNKNARTLEKMPMKTEQQSSKFSFVPRGRLVRATWRKEGKPRSFPNGEHHKVVVVVPLYWYEKGSAC